MDKRLIAQWNERKHLLAEWLAGGHPKSYKEMVDKLVELVLTDEYGHRGRLDPKRVHVIDDGDYQGTQLFLIATDTYQPHDDDYVWFSNHYGSCSGCDTLEGIRCYSEEIPSQDQVRQYMDLALHMIQRMKWLHTDKEVDDG